MLVLHKLNRLKYMSGYYISARQNVIEYYFWVTLSSDSWLGFLSMSHWLIRNDDESYQIAV